MPKTLEVQLILDHVRQRIRLSSEDRLLSVVLTGHHVHQHSLDRGPLDMLSSEIAIGAREDLPADWDQGGWFALSDRDQWVSQHGDHADIGRASYTPPETAEKLSLCAIWIALFLERRDLDEVLAQVRHRHGQGVSTLASVTLGSSAFPQATTRPGDLELSQEREFPVIAVEFTDYPEGS